MKILSAWRALAVTAAAGMLAIGWIGLDPASSTILAATIEEDQGQAGEVLPFHSEIAYEQPEQVPVPEGRCTEPLPPGLAYLWLSKIRGTSNTTHLGTGPIYVELCLFGVLTDPTVPPPGNGIPMGWQPTVETFTAANGDRLMARNVLVGFTQPPGFKFIVTLSFLDGGTGRFEYAEGKAMGFVDPAGTAVYDGWIRYGKREE